MLYLVLILVLVFLMFQTKTENFVEQFGFSGYTPPREVPSLKSGKPVSDTTKFLPVAGGMTHDDINDAVSELTKYVNKESGLCVYPIETSKIQKSINPETGTVLVKARFMYMTQNTGFPFVFGVDAEILNGKVVVANTQELYRGGKTEMTSDNFLPFSEIENFHVYSR